MVRGDNCRCAGAVAAGGAGGSVNAAVRYGRCTVSTTLVRRVWAAVTRQPSIGVRDLARQLGYRSASDTLIALHALRDAGYIGFADHQKLARTIIVPFVVTKKAKQ